MGLSPPRGDQAGATSSNNNYFDFGDSSFDAAVSTLLSSPPKAASIHILQAGDDLKIPALQYRFSPITLDITDDDATNTFDQRVPDLSENVYPTLQVIIYLTPRGRG
jgi:hypothetical protein